MRKIVVVYNPASGMISNRRAGALEEAVAVLRAAGVEVRSTATDGPGSAAELARAAIADGCETVLACGGDGTVNEVLQGMIGSDAALGVLPLGTANALASDLGLPLSLAGAARMLLEAQPKRISIGRIQYRDRGGETQSRYFTVAAGIGADAQLMYRMDAQLKRRFGYALYAVEALRILATDPFPLFEARFMDASGEIVRTDKVSQLLAVRIRNFGGMLQNFAPGAALTNESLRLVAFKTRKRFDYLKFLTAVVGRRHTFNGCIALMEAMRVECVPLKGMEGKVYVEADGELLGGLPMNMDIVPDALNMLIPNEAAL
ncbi:diacylglycerol/lipid kinase family protein [Acidicapsa dinghuensis]|uniref:Diacylglycerol/lipid kinase family protein n=1 Tax=Acidicapsa dinghuensis TaxID=2218256 RepID=A0ABW1EIG6_9BACT|nr:YegS/Rv2252/BmrU family lipid kinase [Acidicapsa dinghuensis]